MTQATGFERVSQIQDEILAFTWEQVADRVDKFYVLGKVTDDDEGRITMTKGNMIFGVLNTEVLNNSEVLSKDEFRANSAFILPRISELHDLLIRLQGKSPVRFRWSVDTKTRQVESDWTYYDDLAPEEKKDDFWEFWKGDSAWRDQLKAELADQ
ncbi:hypothetical protein [Microbacterium sp. NPDC087665]|uniref:hypothetical protein n=1 Tax=Microbacterium sp. NPDC087665 TaxID=3364194 RepID=UPI0038142261